MIHLDHKQSRFLLSKYFLLINVYVPTSHWRAVPMPVQSSGWCRCIISLFSRMWPMQEQDRNRVISENIFNNSCTSEGERELSTEWRYGDDDNFTKYKHCWPERRPWCRQRSRISQCPRRPRPSPVNTRVVTAWLALAPVSPQLTFIMPPPAWPCADRSEIKSGERAGATAGAGGLTSLCLLALWTLLDIIQLQPLVSLRDLDRTQSENDRTDYPTLTWW